MMHAQHELVAPATLIAPAVHAADTTRIGVGGITFDANNRIDFKLFHGDTAVVNDHVAVAQSDVSGVTLGSDGIVRALVASHAAPSLTELSYMGGRAFLSLWADFSGTHGGGTPIAAMVVRGRPLVAPV